MTPRSKYLWAIGLILILLAGIWGTIAIANLKPRLGLDLQGGISVVLAPKQGSPTDTLDQAVDIIRNRVDALGVAEPEIGRQGQNILVQLPGIKEQTRALNLIGTTAQLRFRPVLEEINPGDPRYATMGPKDCGDRNTYPADDRAKEIVLCVKQRDESGKEAPAGQWPKLRMGAVALEGADVSGATADPPTGDLGGAVAWQVGLALTGDGGRKFADITGKLACNPVGDPKRQLAIVLDRVVESHPQMGENVECNRGISGGSAQITGNFGEKEAKDLALVLRYGALPVELEASSTTAVSPTLGRDSLRGGLLAGVIGLAIVFLYVMLFYRALGLVIWLGLILHGSLTLGVITVLGETAGFALSLAGIAGLIVSVGIATDSFIVYFERLKDEVHQGKSVRGAVDRAWVSARRTIVAADLVTALAAVVLYVLAVGGVRGFALMLGLSTGLDVFISYLFMHPVVWWLAQTRRFNESKTLGIGRVVGQPAPVAGGAR
jgi:protein-export membrane protein SecD